MKKINFLIFLISLFILANFAYSAEKNTICHFTHSSQRSYVVIEVDQHSLTAHFNHGNSF